MHFELQTTDPEFFSRAMPVFAPWLRGPCHDPLQVWSVERTANGWVVASDVVTSYTTLDQALLAVEYGANALLPDACGTLALHCALLSREGRGIVIVGHVESGKSTLSCGLWRAGWTLHCDDITLFDRARLRGIPAPRRVSLRPPSRPLLGDDLWAQITDSTSFGPTSKGIVFHPHEIDGRPRGGSVPLECILFLGRDADGLAPGTLRRVIPAQALFALFPHSNLARSQPIAHVIRGLQPLAHALPAYDLARGELSLMVTSVNQLMTSQSTARP